MLYLASASPRRIKMLKNAGLDFTVRPASIIEELPCPMAPEKATMYLAKKKAEAVLSILQGDVEVCKDSLTILAADTVVVKDDRIIGKPENPEEAYNTLLSLRKSSHSVITGCCILRVASVSNKPTIDCFYEETTVHFTDFSEEALRKYIATDEPYDKAGGYAIQGTFARYIESIEGDYDNVVGLPLDEVLRRL